MDVTQVVAAAGVKVLSKVVAVVAATSIESGRFDAVERVINLDSLLHLFDQLTGAGMEVVARDDCLLVTLSAEPVAEWRGRSPVFYGRGGSGGLVSLCVLWDDAARELVLGWPDRITLA
jgi:hypothetical protein